MVKHTQTIGRQTDHFVALTLKGLIPIILEQKTDSFVQPFNALCPLKKGRTYLKQTYSFQLQVCLSMFDLLVDTTRFRVNTLHFQENILFINQFLSYSIFRHYFSILEIKSIEALSEFFPFRRLIFTKTYFREAKKKKTNVAKINFRKLGVLNFFLSFTNELSKNYSQRFIFANLRYTFPQNKIFFHSRELRLKKRNKRLRA